MLVSSNLIMPWVNNIFNYLILKRICRWGLYLWGLCLYSWLLLIKLSGGLLLLWHLLLLCVVLIWLYLGILSGTFLLIGLIFFLSSRLFLLNWRWKKILCDRLILITRLTLPNGGNCRLFLLFFVLSFLISLLWLLLPQR